MAIALFLLIAAIYIRSKKIDAMHVILFGVLGAVSVWFAVKSIFILTGLAVGLSVLYAAKKEWGKIKRLSLICLIWLSGIVSYIYVYLSNFDFRSNFEFVRNFFSSWIVVFPSISIESFRYNTEIFFGIFRDAAGFYLYGIAVFTFLMGCISMYREKKDRFIILIFPLLTTLCASIFFKYPLAARLILFLVPFLLFFMAEGVGYIINKIRGIPVFIKSVFIVLLFFHPIVSAYSDFVNPHTKEEAKPVIEYIKEHEQEADVLYLYYASETAFKYYSKRCGLRDNECILGVFSRDDWQGYIDDLNKLRGIKRVWVFFSHVCTWKGIDEERFFLYQLDKIGTRLDYFKSKGSSAYLYDLSQNST